MPPKTAAATAKKSIEETYKSMTQYEHILHAPDTYIGSVENTQLETWVYNDGEGEGKMEYRNIHYVPGLHKIFDEILVNAIDQHVRIEDNPDFEHKVTQIKVNIDAENNVISITNNGEGVPVVIHKDHNMYVPELVFGTILSGSNYDKEEKKVTGGKNGMGSNCIAPDTLIPLMNGKIKRADEISYDDVLIGDNGMPRNIKNIIKGNSLMYEIEQTKGDSYKVNGQHILTLHMPDHKRILWSDTENSWSVLWWNKEQMCINKKIINVSRKPYTCDECGVQLNSSRTRHYNRLHKGIEIPKKERKSPNHNAPDDEEVKKAYEELVEFCKDIPDDSVFDICIQDYMKLNNTTKMRLAGIRGQCVQWEKQDVEVDPYILGLWLGDGMSCGRKYACFGEKDPQIIEYLTEWAEKNDAVITKHDTYTYNISSKSRFGKKNSSPLKNQLMKYNLIQNKHIPIEYIVNDRDTRLKVLAGLIDTDGHVMRDGTRIGFTQGLMHEQLVMDTLFLARSLGFYCTLNKFKSSWVYKGEKRFGECYKINISGNVEDIPTRLPRKKCNNIKVHSNRTTGQIKIKEIGNGDYVGFEIDGNQRFLINDFTVTHNCANIYSTRFVVETVDSVRKLKYVQVFEKNMSIKHPPVITKCSLKPYTKIEFSPDLSRFGLSKLDGDDTILYMKKRVIDTTACTKKSVNVFLNEKKIDCKGLDKYVSFYLGDKVEKFYEEVNDRWEVVVAISPEGKFDQMSFVNGVATIKGGKHVDNVVTTITNKLIKHVESKRGKVVLKPSHVKENMFIFIKSVIENPAFDSQTKEYLTTPATKFGSKCEVSDKFIEKLGKSSIVERAQKLSEFKQNMDLQKATNLTKRESKKLNIPKLDEANMAGSAESLKCTIILTEGDSAKALAVSGLAVVGRDYFGAFPLKGKPLNVRDVKPEKIRENQEIVNIAKILGLPLDLSNKKRTLEETRAKLRYGHVMIFADQDLDGFHIKGLLINLFDVFWPELLDIPDFITVLSTPIVKAFKGSMNKPSEVIDFYTLPEYEEWLKENQNGKGYIPKYYKGLGTSTAKDAKDYFADFEVKKVTYSTGAHESVEAEKASRDAIDLAFNSKRAEDRKEWLGKFDKNNVIKQSQKQVKFDEFIHKELIQFSNYDNDRSIPSVCDGLKPSQRKILYAAFKKNLVNQMKVAQFSGYVSAEANYHHGEASLNGAIVKMAQDYVGSNNINLLIPEGQFGTRAMGGKDSASERYIFTRLNEVTKHIFNKSDTPLLKQIMDDGDLVEPEYYLPILPMILVNGTTGIGTGYSTDVPMHNPLDIIENLMALMDGKETTKMKPWYRGFTGAIEEKSEKQYINRGVVKIVDDTTVEITELPIETWTSDYKIYLEALIVGSTSSPSVKAAKADASGKGESKKSTKTVKQVIQSFREYHTDSTVKFELKMKKEDVAYYRDHMDELEEYLKLSGKISYTNMTLYDPQGHLKKYESTDDILKEFYMIRLAYYGKRKSYMLKYLKRLLDICASKVRFIEEIMNKTLDIMYKDDDVVEKLLEEKGYPRFGSEKDDLEYGAENPEKSYDYLLHMQIRTFTKSKLDALRKDHQEREAEHKDLESKSEIDLWKIDLNEFKVEYGKMMKEYEERYEEERNKKVVGTGSKVVRKRVVKKA